MKKLCFIFLISLLFACKPSLPSGILSDDEMEDVLYDMHVAQAIYEYREGVATESDIFAIRASVLKKHDIDEATWEQSMQYYNRNSKEMYDIYSSLAERVNQNVVALGGKAEGMQGSEADTANVWRENSAFILMQQPPYNRYSFEITPDSTFNDGDKITLQYEIKMIFQEGYRDVAANLFVYYDNDSVATAVTHSSSDGLGVVTINNDKDRLHIKKISGYFIMSKNLAQVPSNINTSVMRLASIRNVKLLHLHTEKIDTSVATEPEKRDTLKTDSLKRDSLFRNDPPIVNHR